MTYVSWYARTESGLASLQRSLIDIESGVARHRAWNPELVIGLAQTEDYARAVLTACIEVLDVPNDLDEAVAARMQRQLILDREPHTFEFLIGEWALHRTVGSAAVMRAQIKALIDDLDSRPNPSHRDRRAQRRIRSRHPGFRHPRQLCGRDRNRHR
ncbi:Scr1 family TA system antitoxin-like transcriptional regulator [Nocardia fluminea]|uniref:Scr1 family TA system antitoxin-like transcriptional regulator n=1 Tax=Nocardia fluminea TaxID=134984 RepID=UPI0036713EAC